MKKIILILGLLLSVSCTNSNNSLPISQGMCREEVNETINPDEFYYDIYNFSIFKYKKYDIIVEYDKDTDMLMQYKCFPHKIIEKVDVLYSLKPRENSIYDVIETCGLPININFRENGTCILEYLCNNNILIGFIFDKIESGNYYINYVTYYSQEYIELDTMNYNK